MACIINSDMFSNNITPENRKIMLQRMFSTSEKLKNHLLSDGWKNGCHICIKIQTWAEIFIKYEKDNNKKLEIGQIMDEDFVEKAFFSDDVMKILN